MNLLALVAIAALGIPAPQQASVETVVDAPPPIDLRAAVKEVAAQIVAEDLELRAANGWQDPAQPADEQTGYFGMLYGNSYDPSVLSYYGASAADIWSRYELQQTCAASATVECSNGWPGNVSTEIALTAGVYMAATGVQRLAKKYWDVDLDDGWKNLLIFGGLAAVRAAMTWDQVSNANALREFGR